MDIYRKMISNNKSLLLEFIKSLEDKIGCEIEYKITGSCIMLFIDNSSILSIIPDEDEKLTYAHSPKYESDISDAISSLRTRLKREEKIDQIIKKKRTD